jgi:hypothetical protein
MMIKFINLFVKFWLLKFRGGKGNSKSQAPMTIQFSNPKLQDPKQIFFLSIVIWKLGFHCLPAVAVISESGVIGICDLGFSQFS